MNTFTLYQFPGQDGLSVSPFVNKVHFALKLKRLPYTAKTVLFPRPTSATGRLPMLEHAGRKIHDSTEIIRYLEDQASERSLVPRDRHLAARAHVLEEWADETFTPLLQYARLTDPVAMEHFGKASLPTVPGPIRRAAMRIRMRGTWKKFTYLHALGAEARAKQLERNLDAFESFLGDQPWICGEAPSVADVALAAGVHILVYFDDPIEPLSHLRARPRLNEWTHRFFAEVQLAPRSLSPAVRSAAPAALGAATERTTS